MHRTVAVVLLIAGIASGGCKRDVPASAPLAQPTRAGTRTVTLPIEGMICMVCAGSVKNALRSVEGVSNVDVNLEKQRATVVYDDRRITLDKLTGVIIQLGYKAGVPEPARSQ